MTHNQILPPMSPKLLKLIPQLQMPMLKMIQLQPVVRQQKKQWTRPRMTTGTQMHLLLMSPMWLKASEHKSE